MRKNQILLVLAVMVATFLPSMGTATFAASAKYNKCFTGASLPSLIGKNAGTAKVAGVGKKGVLTYGPYVTLPVGSYVATVIYKVSSGVGHQVATMDRAASGKPIAKSPVALIPKKVGSNNFSVNFTVATQLKASEVRVADLGITKLEVDSICILQIK